MAETVDITPREGLGIASVMARKGVSAEAIGGALGLAMPLGPGVAFSGKQSMLGSGPGHWLVMAQDAAPDFAEGLAETLAGLAAVADQSSAYAVWRLAGPGARRLLQRGVAIDLDPATFGPGAAATTVIAHIGVILWRGDDAWHLACFRSHAHSLEHWLERGAAVL